MKSYTFSPVYWGPDESTEVIFEPATELPPQEQITACMVLAVHDGESIIMSKPERGWGLPGGHREPDETAEECLRREAMEEAAVILGELRFIGHWATKKRFHSPHNTQYPDQGYQLLFVASVKELNDYIPQLEISERAIVPIAKVKHYHHDYTAFEPVLNYAVDAGHLKLNQPL